MQEEAAGWGGGAGCGAAPGLENRGHRAGRELAAAYFKHRSDQVADHVMEESVAANAVEKQIL